MKAIRMALVTLSLGFFIASCGDNNTSETDTTMTDTSMTGTTDMSTGAGGTGTDMNPDMGTDTLGMGSGTDTGMGGTGTTEPMR